LEEALLAYTGVLGAVLADVLAWETGGESFQGRSGARPADVERCYLQALAWASEVCGAEPQRVPVKAPNGLCRRERHLSA
jgi:hypothetical protein